MHEGPEKNFYKKPENIVSPEKKEIMESAHVERLEIVTSSLSRIVQSINDRIPQSVKSATSAGANYIPFIAEAKLLIEGVKGKTISGRELNNTDRVLQIVAAATSAIGKGLGAYALAKNDDTLKYVAGATYATSWGATLYSSGKEIIPMFQKMISFYKEKFGSDIFKKPKEQ